MKKPLYYVSIPAILLIVSVYLYQKPAYNWDIFPYMALVMDEATTPFDSTHRLVYREAEFRMPANDYNAMSQRQPVLKADPAAFHEILKYYQIKPAFILFIQFLHFIGFNLLAATYFPSILSYFLIGTLLFFWMQRIFPLPYAALATLLIAASSFLVTPARLSSPDMLCAFVTMAGLFLMTEAAILPGLIITGLAIFIRPDAIILFLLLNLALYKKKVIKPPVALILSVAAILTIFLLVDPGMLREFLFTKTEYSPSWNTGTAFANYLSSLWYGLSSLLNSQIPFFTFMALITLYIHLAYKQMFDGPWTLLMIVVIFTFFFQYLLHPQTEDRFLISCYLLIVIGFCKTIGGLVGSLLTTSNQKT